ncbi:esterase/lipase family protein [Nocardioides sp.]|uniref:esterase/lipase family protein n=1 Tax=Nocardioides sp. TaxID=35761 RepID=UPI00351920DF
MRTLLLIALMVGLVVGSPLPSPARAAAPASTSTPSWLSCPDAATLRDARGVVLLVPGTGSRPDEAFSWGYQRALTAEGYATCTVSLAKDGLASFTRAAVRVRRAIRVTAALAGRRISVIGHSQGGALPVWAVKYWPAAAAVVDDVVSLAGPFGGTQLGNELCLLNRCSPLAWQLRQGSRTVAALRRAPLPARVSVTSLAGPYDEIVRPQPQASELPGAVNIVLNQVCPADPSEHGLILGDPVGWALTLDALTHPGPGDPARIDPATCQQAFIPHGDPAGSPVFVQSILRFALGLANPTGWVDAEPALPRYARGTGAGGR